MNKLWLPLKLCHCNNKTLIRSLLCEIKVDIISMIFNSYHTCIWHNSINGVFLLTPDYSGGGQVTRGMYPLRWRRGHDDLASYITATIGPRRFPDLCCYNKYLVHVRSLLCKKNCISSDTHWKLLWPIIWYPSLHWCYPITALMVYRSSWHVFIPWYISAVQVKMQYVQISNIIDTYIKHPISGQCTQW